MIVSDGSERPISLGSSSLSLSLSSILSGTEVGSCSGLVGLKDGEDERREPGPDPGGALGGEGELKNSVGGGVGWRYDLDLGWVCVL